MSTSQFDEALAKVSMKAVDDIFHRVVALDAYEACDPKRLLFDLGPKLTLTGQRFSPPGNHAGLYVARERLTAGSEFSGSIQEWHQSGGANSIVFKFDVRLANVLDLTEDKTLSELGLTSVEVKSAWEGYFALFGMEPLTWILGRAAFASQRFDGILFPSLRNPQGTNLLIFTERLIQNTTMVTLFNADGSVRERLPV